MTEVEDMSRRGSRGAKDRRSLARNGRWVGEERDRIEVALQSNPLADAPTMRQSAPSGVRKRRDTSGG